MKSKGFFSFVWDDIKTERPPVVTIFLICLNALIFLSIILSAVFFGVENLLPVLRILGFIPANPNLISIFTHMFIHIELLHLLGNMLFLWVFGNNVEDKIGSRKFALLYIGSGLIAILAQYLLNVASEIPTIGASGAISGVLAAYLLLFFNKEVTAVVIGFPARMKVITFAFLFIFYQFLGLFLEIAGGENNIAFFAHVGGFFGGIVLSVFLFQGVKFKEEPIEEIRALNEKIEMLDNPKVIFRDFIIRNYRPNRIKVEEIKLDGRIYRAKVKINNDVHFFTLEKGKRTVVEVENMKV